MKKAFWVFVIWCAFAVFFSSPLFGSPKGFSLLITGNTHSRIYLNRGEDCILCRRASFISDWQAQKPRFLLEIGDVLGGGLGDVKKSEPGKDRARTYSYLSVLRSLGYDAVILSYSIDRTWLKELRKRFSPIYTFGFSSKKAFVLEKDGVRVGILLFGKDVIGDVARYDKLLADMGGVDLLVGILPDKAIPSEGQGLLKLHKEIDIVVVPSMDFMPKPGEYIAKVGQGYLLCPPADGLVGIELDIGRSGERWEIKKAEKVSFMNFKEKRLKGLPSCFSDKDCPAGSCEKGICQKTKRDKGDIKTGELVVVRPRECISCNEDSVFKWLSGIFPGLKMKKVFADETEARTYMEHIKTDMLPVYILPKEIDTLSFFENIEDMVLPSDIGYVLKPQVTGMSVFYKRPRKDKRIDVFISGILDKDAYRLVRVIKKLKADTRLKGWKIYFHYLLTNKGGVWSSLLGSRDMKEVIDQLCVKKYAPKMYLDYLVCRYEEGYRDTDTCVIRLGLDKQVLTSCRANQTEVLYALPESASLVAKTGANVSGLVLFENRQIFKPSPGVFTAENIIKWSQGKETGNE